MSQAAMIMMLISMLVIWGGLAAAIINLTRSTPRPPADQQFRRDL